MSFVVNSDNSLLFKVGKHEFALTFQEDELGGYDIILMQNVGGSWSDFGGVDGGDITDMFSLEFIMAHGSEKGFVAWCMAEAMRRATEHVSAVSLPAGSDNFTRTKFAFANCIEQKADGSLGFMAPWDGGTPLPGA